MEKVYDYGFKIEAENSYFLILMKTTIKISTMAAAMNM